MEMDYEKAVEVKRSRWAALNAQPPIGQIIDLKDPKYEQGLKFMLSPEVDFPSSCDHEPVDVGFQFSKLVCKKCNKVLP